MKSLDQKISDLQSAIAARLDKTGIDAVESYQVAREIITICQEHDMVFLLRDDSNHEAVTKLIRQKQRAQELN